MAQAATTNVPPSAQKQIRAAEKIYQQVYGENKDDAVAGEPQETVQTEESPKDARQEVEQPKAEAKPESEKAAPAQQKTEPDYKAQYDALKGKYNKEVVPLQQQVRSLTAEIDSLRSVIASMESEKPKKSEPVTAEERFITEADIDDFGEDTIDLIRRVAREESQAKIRELERRNAELERQVSGVGQTIQVSARERLLSSLDSQVPNWRDINTDDNFLAWLQDRDPYAGVQRHTMLKQAYENNDAARVVAFFRGYLGEHAVVSEQPPAHEEPTRQAQVNMETLVAPGRPKGQSVRAQEDGKRMWSQNEIRAFYRDVQNRKFVGREKEKERLERDIVSAAAEGRIVA
jgi:hypothetical protein